MKIKSSIFAFMLMVSGDVARAEDSPFEKDAAMAVRDIFCHSQYTILGDTNHDDASIVEFIAQDSVLDAMQACGVSAIYAERAPEMQDNFDKVAAGSMELDEFIHNLEEGGYGDGGYGIR